MVEKTKIVMEGKKEKSRMGRLNRAAGRRFETKVREKLEGMGWVVSKWMNTIDYEKNKVVPAKRKYNPYKKAMAIGTGFPDFVAIKNLKEKEIFNELGEVINSSSGKFDVVGVEVKANGYLDKIEKGMCLWLLENKIFSRILIARKGKKRGEIEYEDFREKYGKNFD